MRFGIKQRYRTAISGISTAFSPVVVFDALVKIRGYPCIKFAVTAAEDVNEPGGCRCFIHRK